MGHASRSLSSTNECLTIATCVAWWATSKKGITRFREDFVDPGQNFPYGEWLKAPVRGSGMRGEHQNSQRGAQIFEASRMGSMGSMSVRDW